MPQDQGASVPDQALVNGAASVSALPGFDPSRDVQFWPFGDGVVATAPGSGEAAGLLCIAGVADDLLRDDWSDAEPPAWDEICAGGGPLCFLRFRNSQSVDRFIAQLDLVKAELAIATEAGTAATAKQGAVHEGAGLQGIAQP